MTILTFDLETENHISCKRKASPFDKRNYIVEAGWSFDGGERFYERYDEWHRDEVMKGAFSTLGKGDIINGFNIKFDLLWIWWQPELQAALKRGATIYCGQYVEYLLGGHTQDVQMCAMNDIAETYGGGCKIDAVKELWEDGYLTSEIPSDLLHDYLCGTNVIVGDVHNTWLILKGQIKRMREEHPPEFRKMLKLRLDGLLATIECEYNGIHVDERVAEADRLSLIDRIKVADEQLQAFIPKLPPEYTFSWGSTKQKSALIFGGTVKYDKWVQNKDDNGDLVFFNKTEVWPLFRKEPVCPTKCSVIKELHYLKVPNESEVFDLEYKGKKFLVQDTNKSGKNAGLGKTKQVKLPDYDKPSGAKRDHYFTFEGYTLPDAKWKSATTDAFDGPLYSTAADVIEELGRRDLPFTQALSQFTKLTKDMSTYYWTEDAKGNRKGMLTLLGEDGIIHHMINHVNTVTSRLSSSNPNMQNIPRKDMDKSTGLAKSFVKRMFTSRFKNGLMGEIDYSQLEIVIQGVLTRDEQLMADLLARVDFHCKRLSVKLDEDYQYVWDKCHTEEDPQYKIWRTGAKIFSFQRAYGAGVKLIAEETGMSIEDVEALVAAELLLYPKIDAFDKMLEKEINRNRVPTSRKIIIDGVPFTQGESHWDSPTGTRFVWREHETPKFMHAKGKYTGFSPTERKNYGVQGVGGEVVQAMLGKVFRYLIENDRFDNKLLLVNTVHDCAWFDGETNVMNKQMPIIQKIMESVPEVYNEAFPELNVEVPFPCETEVGKDMFDMTVLH